MQIHSRAARGSFGLEEVGKTSQDEDTAHMRVSNNIAGQGDLPKPSDHGALSQGLSQFCLSPGQGEKGWSLRMLPGSSAWSQGPDLGEQYVAYVHIALKHVRVLCAFITLVIKEN